MYSRTRCQVQLSQRARSRLSITRLSGSYVQGCLSRSLQRKDCDSAPYCRRHACGPQTACCIGGARPPLPCADGINMIFCIVPKMALTFDIGKENDDHEESQR